MTLRGISTSDWHLDGGLSRLFPEKALDKQLFEINKVFQYAVENDIRHVFMPGDISDKARLSESTLIALITLLMKYDRFVSFHYILGNHDVAQVGKTSIDVLKIFAENGAFKNVHVYTAPKIVEIGGVDVGFVPYPHTSAPKNDRPTLLFAHVEEAGAIGDYGTPLKSHGLKLNRCADDYTISGHLHTYQELKSRRMLYNGALFQKTFGESLPKGFVEFQAKYSKEGKLLVRHQFVDNRPSFRLDTLRIEQSADWDQLEAGEHVFYRIYMGEGVVAPRNITRDIPNIISLNGTSYRGRSNVDITEKSSVDDIPKITPLTGLIEALQNYDLSKDEIKQAVRLVKDAIKQLNEG
jgi:DNA repair exonuclease SbcCD nuclease subunit